MPDLHQRFRTLDRIQVPDLRPDIRTRQPRPPRREIRLAGIGTVVLALAIGALGIAVAVRGFLGQQPREDGPTAPPGHRLTVVLREDQGNVIHQVNQDGSTTPIVEGRDPAWSPDGSWVAFRRGNQSGGGQTTIYLANGDGSDVVTIEPDTLLGEASGEAGPPVWSPDGSLIAFDTLGGVYVARADGSNLRQVSEYEGESACYDLQPSWSPDGTKLLFAVLCDGGNEGIWTVNLDGSGRTQLLGPDGDLRALSQPMWSSDGTRIAFSGATHTGPRPWDFQDDIWVMDADGTGARPLTDGSGSYHDPAWSPDGTRIAYTDWTTDRVMVMDADGSNPHPVTDPGIRACCPAWRPATEAAEPSPTLDPTPTQEPIARGATITIPVGRQPAAIAAADGVVWTSVANRRLVRIDQATNELVATVSLPRPAWELAAAPGAVWAHGYVRNGPDVLLQVDPETNRVSSEIQLDDYVGPLIADAEGVWVITTDEGEDPGGQDDRRRLLRIDAATNEITVSTPIEGYVDEIGLAEGSVWLMHWEAGSGGNERCGQVSRVDASTGEVMETIPADGLNLAAGPGAVWTSCRVDPGGAFVARRIEPATSAVSDPIPLPGGYGPAGVVEGGVWFTGYDDQTRVRVFFMDRETFEISGSVRLRSGYYTGATYDPETATIWIAHTSEGGSVVRVDLR
jgi:hypothetical protein